MLRASARALGSARPKAAVCGRIARLSAPPTAAANAAIVVRNRFEYGSERVIIRRLVSA
jgi:hypothetical protein